MKRVSTEVILTSDITEQTVVANVEFAFESQIEGFMFDYWEITVKFHNPLYKPIADASTDVRM